MLNPECVDVEEEGNEKTVYILFTDGDGDQAVTIQLTDAAAMRLSQMITKKCSYKAKLDACKIE